MVKSTSRSIQNKKLLCTLLSLLWLAALAGCDLKPVTSPTPAIIQATITPSNLAGCLAEKTNFTNIVQAINSMPSNYEGTEVLIIGYYRGWDQLKEASGKSPVTRSDWVIRDQCGAIYVQAGGEGIGSLNPGSLEDTHKVLRLTGIVRLTAEKQAYIDPKQVEIIP